MVAAEEEAAIMPAAQPRQGVLGMPTAEEWALLVELGNAAYKSGLCPDGVRSGEAAAIIMLSGHELGILPMQALRMIYVVNGRPSLAADLMKALIAREGAGYIEVVEETDDHITQRAVRTDGRGAREPQVFTWSQADTDKAQLAGSSMNKNYPRVHKEHRSTAVLARRVFPDIIGGLLCTEEAEELPAPRVIEAHFENAPDTTEPPAPPEPEKPTTLGTEGVAEFNRSMQEAADECVRAGVLAEADEAGLLKSIGMVTKKEVARRGFPRLADLPADQGEEVLASALKQLPALPTGEDEDQYAPESGGPAAQPLLTDGGA